LNVTNWRIILTQITSNTNQQLVSSFEALSTDQKLALLWYIYKEVGKSITPAAPGASTAAPAIAEGLFKQVLEMSHEEQLQVQRDLVNRTDSAILPRVWCIEQHHQVTLLVSTGAGHGSDRNYSDA
jgi:Orange carotenoid protein, N-terminal